MILRKPYALLIKNFKKIHLLLCVLMAYLAYESSNILTFFNDYIREGTFSNTSFSLASSYVNIYMFIITILVAAIALIIFILMRQKKKPTLLYLLTIAMYLGLIIFFFQIYGTLNTLEISSISPRTVRIIRDIASIICYLQYAVILIMSIRAVGFNIKKFNFGEDLAELEIDVSDNEEFELTVGIDPDKIGRRLRRGKREAKYFIVENFFVLSLISLVVIATLGVGLFLNFEVYNKIYKQTQSFKVNFFVNKINNCYYTHLNQRGIDIAPKGKTFIVTKATFENRDAYPQQLSLDDINLVSGDDIFSPVITRYQAFIDLGTGYTNQLIKPGESNTYIFVFEVDEDTNFNNLIFRYMESLKISTAKLEAKYKKVKLNIEKLDNITVAKQAKTGEELVFNSSQLDDTKLKISEYLVADNFAYDATSCTLGTCSTYKNNLTLQYTTTQSTLLWLSFDYTKGTNSKLVNSDNLLTLIKSYGFIRYRVSGGTFNMELINKTPSNYYGKDLYYQVSSGVKYATAVDLVIRVRNKEYVYSLK